jgi:ArsR family transcriptional regulator
MGDIVTTFKALADETRLRVLKLLSRGELCVCEIAAALAIEQPRLSFHLRILKEAGIVRVRRQERWIIYSLNEGDVLIRFLLLAINERISVKQARLDLERLTACGGRGKICSPEKHMAKKKQGKESR